MYFGHSHDLSVPLLEEILMGAWSSGSCQGAFSLSSLSPFGGRSAVYLACARAVVGGALAIPLVVVELPPHFQAVPLGLFLFLSWGEVYFLSIFFKSLAVFNGSFASCSASKSSPKFMFFWEVGCAWAWGLF